MNLKLSCASVCGFLLSAASSVVLALPAPSGAFGSAVEVTGQIGLFSETDSHFGSHAASVADISFIFGGSLTPSEAHASAAVNSLSASVTSFSNILVTGAAEYWDTLTFSAPAGTTTIPVAVNANFFPNLQVLAGGDFFGYAYALKKLTISLTAPGFMGKLDSIDCLSSLEPGASVFLYGADPCGGVSPGPTTAIISVPVSADIKLLAFLGAEAGAVPGCSKDANGNPDCNHAVGSFARAIDPLALSITPLISGVSFVAASGEKYVGVASAAEPSSLLLLGIALAGLGFSRRKRAAK